MTKTKRRAGLVAAAIALGTVGLMAEPASAGTYPRCNGSTSRVGNDGITNISTPSYNGQWQCTMRRGEVGNEVRALQRTLNNCYGASLSVDGEFGPKTEAALKNAEASIYGQTVDGIYSATSDHWKDNAWVMKHSGYRDSSSGNPVIRCDWIGPFPSYG